MKRRAFDLNRAIPFVDLTDDEMLLQSVELEVKLAARFFAIIEFIDANPDTESKEDRELLARLGLGHWLKAKGFLQRRREAGMMNENNENGRKSSRQST